MAVPRNQPEYSCSIWEAVNAYDGKYFADIYWNSYIERFSWDRMTATHYPDSVVLINWNLYQPLGVAYLCGLYYPEVFGEDYGDRVHQEFIDSFYSDLSSVNYQPLSTASASHTTT